MTMTTFSSLWFALAIILLAVYLVKKFAKLIGRIVNALFHRNQNIIIV